VHLLRPHEFALGVTLVRDRTMLLNDEQLVELDPNVIKGLDRSGDLYDAKSPIQPASIDLHLKFVQVNRAVSKAP